MLADDCVVLGGSGEILLTPGYPGTRLWKDSFDALGVDPVRSAELAGSRSKRRALELSRYSAVEPQPLKRIYHLHRLEDDAAGPSIKEMPRVEAMIGLVAASYHFNPSDRSRHLRKFRFLERLVASVPSKKLLIPNDFAALPTVRDLVVADVRGRLSTKASA